MKYIKIILIVIALIFSLFLVLYLCVKQVFPNNIPKMTGTGKADAFGFGFEYPVYKGWNVEYRESTLIYTPSLLYKIAHILSHKAIFKISRVENGVKPDLTDYKTNPHGILYKTLAVWGLTFFDTCEITISKPISPFNPMFNEVFTTIIQSMKRKAETTTSNPVVEKKTNADSLLNPKNADYKIVETRTFSEIRGITFDFPVFKDWEIKEIVKKNEGEYVIFVKWPSQIDFEIAPQIMIRVDLGVQSHLAGGGKVLKNNYNAQYQYFWFVTDYVPGTLNPEFWDAIHFFKSETTPKSYMIIVPIGSGNGFSREGFAKMVIETFRFTD